MFFKILFLVSLIGIIFLYFRTSKKDLKKVLHGIRKSCNIDSIRFEKRFLFFVFFIKKQFLKIFSKIKLIFYNFINHKNIVIHKTKKNIRKKLFVSEQKEKVSEFISEMKK